MLSFMAKKFWLGVDPQAHSNDVMRLTVDSLASMWVLLAFTKCPEKFIAVKIEKDEVITDGKAFRHSYLLHKRKGAW